MEDSAYLLFYLFVGVFVLVAAWERLRPRRRQAYPLMHRWFVNGTLLVLNTATIRLLLPASAVLASVFAEQRAWGLLNIVDMPLWFDLLLSVVILDLFRYWVHRALHQVPVLWRLHRIHHADPDYDLTTGLRFHPLEALLSGAVGLCLVVMLGAAPVAVLVSEAIAIVNGFFAHGNAGMSDRLDRCLRTLIVTPDMHRVHHSTDIVESNRNYSSVFSIWDRLFGSYVAQPGLGHAGMSIGLDDMPREDGLDLWTMLMAPFARKAKAGE